MSRNSSILLNRATKVLKKLDYKTVGLTVAYNSVDVTFPGINKIGHSWESVFEMFKKENITWTLRTENNTMILNILL